VPLLLRECGFTHTQVFVIVLQCPVISCRSFVIGPQTTTPFWILGGVFTPPRTSAYSINQIINRPENSTQDGAVDSCDLNFTSLAKMRNSVEV
jgi:hypothetical protein